MVKYQKQNVKNVFQNRGRRMREIYIDTPCGSIKGVNDDGVNRFLGIRYANAKRFEYAEEVTSWEGVYEALDYGAAPIQMRTYEKYRNENAHYEVEFLKDVKVDRNSDEYILFKTELIYGENFEELTEKEQKEAKEKYETSLAIAGYNTEEEINEYFDLEYRRTVYAKKAYAEWVKNNPYDAETLESAYLEMNASKYNDSVDAIVVTFDSEAEALEVLKGYGVDTENLNSSENWINKEKNEKRITLVDELETKEAELEKETDEAKKAELETAVAKIKEDLAALGLTTKESYEKPVYFTELEIHQIFIDMYNFMNAFFKGGDVSDYYDENGKLDAKYNVLVKDVHYEVVEKKVNKVIGDSSTETTINVVEIKDGLNEEMLNKLVNETSNMLEIISPRTTGITVFIMLLKYLFSFIFSYNILLYQLPRVSSRDSVSAPLVAQRTHSTSSSSSSVIGDSYLLISI